MLVLDGRPVELEAHLARLHASLEALYPHLAPRHLDLPGKPPTGKPAEALRITVALKDDAKLETTVEWRVASGRFVPGSGDKAFSEGVSLESLKLPGGLGAHKWADRSLLDEAQAGLPEDAVPLLVDEDGSVLEASRANVFAVRDGAIFTPPTDGRILPGITRTRVLQLAEASGLRTREAELSGDDLLGADEVFLTGSVRGIERVRALDGTPLSESIEVTRRIAAELRRAWLGAQVG